jgi:hypothetical protein
MACQVRSAVVLQRKKKKIKWVSSGINREGRLLEKKEAGG